MKNNCRDQQSNNSSGLDNEMIHKLLISSLSTDDSLSRLKRKVSHIPARQTILTFRQLMYMNGVGECPAK